VITTLLVDDAVRVRRSLRLLLETTPDIRVAGEASNGVDAVRLARALRPDVVLMDLRMPGGGGLDAIAELSGPGVERPIPVLVLTTLHLDEYIYGAFERGAVGYLLKKNLGDIPSAIRAAVNTSALQSPAVRERLIAEWAHRRRLNP
jgi:DNA-binding NarL/FixJ family response regulator